MLSDHGFISRKDQLKPNAMKTWHRAHSSGRHAPSHGEHPPAGAAPRRRPALHSGSRHDFQRDRQPAFG